MECQDLRLAAYSNTGSTSCPVTTTGMAMNKDGLGDPLPSAGVNILDIGPLAAAINSVAGGPDYDEFADGNGDGDVNILDLGPLGANVNSVLPEGTPGIPPAPAPALAVVDFVFAALAEDDAAEDEEDVDTDLI